MRKNLIFIFMVVLLLAPWPVAYAYDNALTGQEQMQVEVRAAEASAAPTWTVFGRGIGGVTTPGDLFHVGNTDNAADILVTLYLTNAEELIYYYRYLVLNVGIYFQNSDDQWERATAGNGELIPDIYLTMRNGWVSFTLPGYTQYKITIDSGSFYANDIGTDGGSASPKFYLSVEWRGKP